MSFSHNDDSHASYQSMNDEPSKSRSLNQSDDDDYPSLASSSSTDSNLHHETITIDQPSIHSSINQSDAHLDTSPSFKQTINQSIKTLSWYFPLINWLPAYHLRSDLIGDLLAGLTVGLMLVPQSMAYAMIARLSIMTGLFSGMIGCFIYCLFGTARDLNVGPTSVLSLLVLSSYVDADTLEERTQQAAALALIAGIIQLVLGGVKLGILLDFIAHPIISGFTSASALTIASVQIKNLTGILVSDTFIKNVYFFFKNITMIKWRDTILGVMCITTLLLLSKLKRYRREERFVLWFICTARNAIVVFLATGVTAIVAACGYEWWATVPKIADTESLLPQFSTSFFKSINQSTFVSFLSSGFAIACVGILEGIAVAKSFAKQNGYSNELRMSQELIASGACQTFGSFFGCYTVGGSFSRTAVNSAAGVRTPLGGVFAGILVLLALLFASPLFHYIPESALAAVIMSAVMSMVDFDYFLTLYRMGEPDSLPNSRSTDRPIHQSVRYQSFKNYLIDWILVVLCGPVFVPLCLYYRRNRSPAPQAWWDLLTLVTAFWGCLAFSIEIGIFLAVCLSLAITFYRASTPSVVHLHPHQPSDLSTEQSEHQPLIVKRFKDQVLCVRIDGNIMFYSINSILAKIRHIEMKYYTADQSINQSISRSVNQSNKQTNQSIDQLGYQSEGLTASLLNDEEKEAVDRSIDSSVDASNDHSVNQSLEESDHHNGLLRSTSEENRLRSLENNLEDLSVLHHSTSSRLGCLILDFVSVSEVDTSGVDGLVSLVRDLDDVVVLLVHCKPAVRRFLFTALALTRPVLWNGRLEEHFFDTMTEANAYAAKMID